MHEHARLHTAAPASTCRALQFGLSVRVDLNCRAVVQRELLTVQERVLASGFDGNHVHVARTLAIKKTIIRPKILRKHSGDIGGADVPVVVRPLGGL